MSAPVSTKNAERYTWGEICEGWHLVRDEQLSVIEERMPPSTREERHLHTHSRQFFYVLSGELAIELDEVRHTLTAHEGLEIPPGSPHQVMNLSAEDVHFLVISQLPSRNDRQPA